MKSLYIFLMLFSSSFILAENFSSEIDVLTKLRSRSVCVKNKICNMTGQCLGFKKICDRDPRRAVLWAVKGKLCVSSEEVNKITEDQFVDMCILMHRALGQDIKDKNDIAIFYDVLYLNNFLERQAEKEKHRIVLGLDETESDDD